LQIHLIRQNVLASALRDASVDAVICSFGIKTLTLSQQRSLAAEINRLLKPGGTFALVEVSAPPFGLLRRPYLWYLKRVIPIVGRVMLGNPETYRMLGIYTERFGNAQNMVEVLREAGLDARYDSYFFGCASGVSGRKGWREGAHG